LTAAHQDRKRFYWLIGRTALWRRNVLERDPVIAGSQRHAVTWAAPERSDAGIGHDTGRLRRPE